MRDAVRTPPPCLGRLDVKHNDHHDDSGDDNDFDEGNNDNDNDSQACAGLRAGRVTRKSQM